MEELRNLCKQSRFYFFSTVKDFDNKIDYNGKSMKNIIFDRGLIDEGKDNRPTRYSAYGTKKT